MNVLVVDDTPENSDMISLMLTHHKHEVYVASNGYEALDILQEHDIQLVVVDWMMPEMDGIELVQRIRSAFSERYIYIIMLSAKDTKGDVVFGLESGVDDYMSKPFSSRELMARVSIGERVINLESRLSESLKEAENLAKHDHLTGLFNRRHFFEIAQPYFAVSVEPSSAPAVILFDIDHFKQINDTYGHLAGDQVLCEVSKRCRQALPAAGIIARYGGEEFVVLLPEHRDSAALVVAENLRKAVAENAIATDESPVDVSISLGVAVLEAASETLEELINTADIALYAAKQKGRNRVILFDKKAMSLQE